MNPNFWQLLYGATQQSFADWGIEANSCVREQQNHAAGKFRFRITAANVDAAPPFAAEQIVRIFRNGVGYFSGPVTRLSRTITPSGEAYDYELTSYLWFAANITYQQLVNIASNPADPASGLTTALLSQAILFQSIGGARINTAAQFSAAMTYAGLAIGLLNLPDVKPPYSEIKDQTCLEVGLASLRWTPDACLWENFAAFPPQIMVANRAGAPAISFALADNPSGPIIITPRYDLQCAGVKIIYRTTNTLDTKIWVVPTYDSVGSPDGVKGVICTVELSGTTLTTSAQKVTLLSINVTARDFWEAAYPWLHQATGVTIENVRVNNSLVTGQTADPADAASGYAALGIADFTGAALSGNFGTSNFQTILASGHVPSWLESHFKDATITSKISYTLLHLDTGAEEVVTKKSMPVKVKICDLNSSPFPQTFVNQTSFTPAEDVPTGVAAAYFAAASVLHYEGSWTIVEEECSGQFHPGMQLNLTGGPTEWSSMGALIQSVSENLGTGQTTLNFGPPPHLSVQDFIALLNVQRNRQRTTRLSERITGESTGNSSVTGPIKPVQSNSASPSAPGKKLVVSDIDGSGNLKGNVSHDASGTGPITIIQQFYAGTAPGTAPVQKQAITVDANAALPNLLIENFDSDGLLIHSIALDLEDIPAGAIAGLGNVAISLRELDYCDGSMPKKIAVLCSLPY